MIFLDTMGHLITNGPIDELHAFAAEIGMRRDWFQDKEGHPHYDVTSRKLHDRAVRSGAILIDPKMAVHILAGDEIAATYIRRHGFCPSEKPTCIDVFMSGWCGCCCPIFVEGACDEGGKREFDA